MLKQYYLLKQHLKTIKEQKINDDALNFPNLQLALAHQVSNDVKSKESSRYLDLITKSVEKEKEWLYNLSILKLFKRQGVNCREQQRVIKFR